MATYREIQEAVRANNGFVPKTCWIADIKSQHDLTSRSAPNRQSLERRVHPCPADKRNAIEDALGKFGMIA